MKLIHIRGGHASGKTETVRQYLNKHQHREEHISAGAFDSIVTITDTGVIVLGQYAEAGCGGVDRYKSVEHVKRTIIAVCGARTIIFEGMIYGRRYKSTKEIINVANTLGYEYHGVLIERDLRQRAELIRQRNGGKSIDMRNFVQSSRDARNSTMRLLKDGYRVDVVNVTEMTKEQMGEIIEQRI